MRSQFMDPQYTTMAIPPLRSQIMYPQHSNLFYTRPDKFVENSIYHKVEPFVPQQGLTLGNNDPNKLFGVSGHVPLDDASRSLVEAQDNVYNYTDNCNLNFNDYQVCEISQLGYEDNDNNGEEYSSKPACSGFESQVVSSSTSSSLETVAGDGQVTVERRRGKQWTEDEHKLFLLGLKKYRKGDWKSISRNYVTTRSSTQVASHAQKCFKRRASATKRKRSSIHDITDVDDDAIIDLVLRRVLPLDKVPFLQSETHTGQYDHVQEVPNLPLQDQIDETGATHFMYQSFGIDDVGPNPCFQAQTWDSLYQEPPSEQLVKFPEPWI